MTRQTPDDGRGYTASFKIADEKIDNLLKRLANKNVCPCCTARALAFHAASEAEHAMGSAEAIDMFEGIISGLHDDNVPAPERAPSIEEH